MPKICVLLEVMSGLEQARGPNRQRINNNNNNNNNIKEREIKETVLFEAKAIRHSVDKLLRTLNRRSGCVITEKIYYRAWKISISEDTHF
jgi:hypothetical protein